MAPEMSTKIFSKNEINYSLRNSTVLQGKIIKIVMYSSETISIKKTLWPLFMDGVQLPQG